MTNSYFSKKHVRKISILCLLVLSVVCLFGSVIGMVGFAQETSLTGVELKEYYNIGDELTVENGTLHVGGQEYSVKPTITYPDGSAYNSNVLTLNQLGKYTATYEVEVAGKLYSEIKEFNVYNYLFSNSVTGETFRYGDYEVEFDESTPDDNVIKTGLSFNLLNGEELLYNKIVDLNDNDATDPLIKFIATPATYQNREAMGVIVVLTDLYDSSNQIKIRVQKASKAYTPDEEYSHINAIHDDAQEFQYMKNGQMYYGIGCDNGLRGTVTRDAVELRFDYANKRLYAPFRGNNSLVKDFIADFPNNEWEGFTTGECWLSLYVTGYVSTDTTIPFSGMILEIDGEDFTGNESGSFSTSIVTETNSQIIDFAEYESAKNVPKAMVGYAYKVFDSNFNSIYGNEKLYTNVYYAYNSSSKYEVPVFNGTFVPDKVGVYTIVYTAVDVFGNVSKTLLDVTAIPDTGYGIYVEVPGYENHLIGNVGERVELVGVENVITEGNLGTAEITISAINSLGQIVDVTNNNFVPAVGGEWEIVYTAKDHAGRIGKFPYKLNVEVSDKVVFGEPQDMPKYFIVGAKNPIPSIQYIDYNVQNPASETCSDIVVKKGSKVFTLENSCFVPEEAGIYEVVYSQDSSLGITNTKSYFIRAIDVNFKGGKDFDKSKYFYSDNGDVVNSQTNDLGAVLTLKPNAKVDFIRPIAANNIDLSYFVSDNSPMNKLNLYLTDVNNPDQMLKISIIDNVGDPILQINDSKNVVLTNVYYRNAKNTLTINNGVLVIGAVTTLITNFYNGDEFTGFESLLANLVIEIGSDSGVAENSVLRIDTINGQPFASPIDAKPDKIAPRIVSSESYLQKFDIGTRFKLPYVKIVDVLCPFTEGSLAVLAPDRSKVLDINNNELYRVDFSKDYYFDLSMPGMYRICYGAQDEFKGKVISINNNFAVIESVSREKAEITISGGSRSGKVGDTISISKKVTVEGSFAEYKLYVFVKTPQGNMDKVEIADKDSTMYYKFSATKKGTYTVIYMVLDEWDNMTTAQYTVKVS